MDALAWITKTPAQLQNLYVLPGDEAFLKRQVVGVLRKKLGDEDLSFSTFAGDKTTFAEVFDELETVGFFSPKRLIVVDSADPFVSKYRAQLEKKVNQLPASGVLVLEVKSWAANTRLAKMVADASTLTCAAPKGYRLGPWCVEWARLSQQKTLANAAADLLVDLVGSDLGLLDQEITKLSIYVGNRTKIEAEDVDKLVGNQREESTWKIFDALATGQKTEALGILDRLFEQGDDAHKIVGAFGFQFRKLAMAARLAANGLTLGAALQQAGVPPFGQKTAETQLKHLGRKRAERLYEDLLNLNMNLRGESPLPPRVLLERFLIELASA